MAFKNQDLSVIAYANGFTLWSYKTSDTITATKTAGYFSQIASFAREGDMILTVCSSTKSSSVAILYISKVSSDSVIVSDIVK